MFQRDIFIQEVIKKLETDKSIYFLSADFGAPALDVLRDRFPKNFIVFSEHDDYLKNQTSQ